MWGQRLCRRRTCAPRIGGLWVVQPAYLSARCKKWVTRAQRRTLLSRLAGAVSLMVAAAPADLWAA